MSSDCAIQVQDLGKCYQMYDTPRDRLLQMLYRGRKRLYREFWALQGVSFGICKGEVFGIVGRNGAGKSTLLQLICGTLNPTTGSLAVQGRVAALLELGAGFNPEFTGRENVYLNASVLGLTHDEIDKRYEEIVAFSGIGDFIHQPVKTYSSGMFVRLAFSVATSVEPDILVVDEALSVGDGDFARKSFDRIMELKQKGTTILFCSHSLYQVEAFCDRALWLEQGKVVAQGGPRDVIAAYKGFLLGSVDENGHHLETVAVENMPADVPVYNVMEGQARFTAVTVLMDGKQDKQLRGRSGISTLSIRLAFVSDPGLPPPTIGVTLDYGPQISATCVISRSDGVQAVRDKNGNGEVELVFPQLPLRGGPYQIGVYLGCENALHIYESALNIAEFTMDDSYPEPGLAILPHQWISGVDGLGASP